jgi:outer membrane lipoprotein SlyB
MGGGASLGKDDRRSARQDWAAAVCRACLKRAFRQTLGFPVAIAANADAWHVTYTNGRTSKRRCAMKQRLALLLCVALAGGCAEMGSLGGTPYGETGGTVASQSDRNGSIAQLETIQVDDNYKLGIGTAVGAVAGGLLGAGVGDSTTATVAGAVLGGAAGTYAESKIAKKDAQRVTVNMVTGGRVTITQPTDARLREGMLVRVEGSGENARVVPR